MTADDDIRVASLIASKFLFPFHLSLLPTGHHIPRATEEGLGRIEKLGVGCWVFLSLFGVFLCFFPNLASVVLVQVVLLALSIDLANWSRWTTTLTATTASCRQWTRPPHHRHL